MAPTTSDLAKGIIIRYKGDILVVGDVLHRTPGNLRAFFQVKMRSIKTGRIIEHRFRAGEEVDVVSTERRLYQILYKNGNRFSVMNTRNFEQLEVDGSLFGKGMPFIKEGLVVDIVFADDGEIVLAELPTFIELAVIETDPITKDDRATPGTKSAKLETGVEIQTPMFIKVGDIVRVDTRTQQYTDRVKV